MGRNHLTAPIRAFGLAVLRGVARPLVLLRHPRWLRQVLLTPGMISRPEAEKLYDLARHVDDGCIVEVGSFRGRSTAALAYGSQHGHQIPIYAVDPHEEYEGILGAQFGPEDRREFFRTMVRTSAYRLVRLLNAGSELVTAGWQQPVSLLWLDGDHTYEGVKRDLECWQPHLPIGAVVAFDDATRPEIGPYRLIDELTTSGRYVEVEQVDKVRILRRAA